MEPKLLPVCFLSFKSEGLRALKGSLFLWLHFG